MYDTEYANLRFERPIWTVRRRLALIGATSVVFTLLWWFVSRNTQYWIILLLIATLTWVASYGWRGALAAFHDVIHRLEQF